MEFSNFYTLETLRCLNDAHDYGYDVSGEDTDKVNRLISFIQKERDSHEEPIAGDIIEYTTQNGDYYTRAHIERIKDGYLEICLSPHVPFCYEDTERASYDTSGGPWTHLDKVSLEPAGIRAKLFKTWGHCGQVRKRSGLLQGICPGMEICGTGTSVREIYNQRMDQILHQ